MKKCVCLLFVIMVRFGTQAQTEVKGPTLALNDLRGKPLRLADYQGKVVLLNFWATWCIPCRTEIPELVKLQTKYRAQGLRIIGVTYPPETTSQVSRFIRRLRVNYPIALGTKYTKSSFTSSETLPVTVIIDREGKVRDIIEGIMYPDEFAAKVKPLLSSLTRDQVRRTGMR